jgi:hypothetical protein
VVSQKTSNASSCFFVFLPSLPGGWVEGWERGAGGVRGPTERNRPDLHRVPRYIVPPIAAGIDFRRYRKLRRFVARVFLQVF